MAYRPLVAENPTLLSAAPEHEMRHFFLFFVVGGGGGGGCLFLFFLEQKYTIVNY